ncbi:unnamed protein product [Calypogeia fissa]
MVDFNAKGPGNQHPAEEKFPYIHLEDDSTRLQMGSEHVNILSMVNGELHASEVWFSNGLDSEQRMASHIHLMGDSALLEDEIWPEFLSQPTPRPEDADMQDAPSTPLHNKNPKRIAQQVLDEMDTDEMDTAQIQRSLDARNPTNSQRTNPSSSLVKTKTVHWPEVTLLDKELKRQRSGVQSLSSTVAIKDNAIPNTVLPQSFQNNSGNSLGGANLSQIDSAPESAPQFCTLQRMDFEVSQVAGVNVSTASRSDTPSANGLESSNSVKANDQTIGDTNAANRQMPVTTCAVSGAPPGKNVHKESVEKDHSVRINVLSTSKGTSPVGNGKNGPKSHHVQLVERHTGFRMISTAGALAESGLPRDSRWAEELLLECAQAISSRNVVRTQHLMWVLNDLGCLTGDANQRLAAHGLKSLFCKLTGTGDTAGINLKLGQVNAGPKTVHRALLKFHDVNPWHHMVYTVANSVMIDNFEGEERVHVIDIGVSQGTQWPTFIEALATRASGPPLLRLTVVKDDDGADSPGVQQGHSPTDFMIQLERFAKLMGIKMELRTVVSSLENLCRRELGIREGEALAICAQFRLHRLSEATEQGELDEVSHGLGKATLSARDKFLQFMRKLKPRVVILSENDTDQLDSDFITRFRPTVDYFWKFLDSTSYSFHGKQSEERQIIEYEAAMAMVNNVACEGSHRIERNESHRGWTERMERAQFASVMPREEILENIRTLIRKYDANWEFGTDMNCVLLMWKHQPVTFCSVWKPL